MSKFLGITFVLMQMFPQLFYAQDVLKSGLLGEIKVKTALPNNWQLESKFQNRQILFESALGQELAYSYKYERTDIGNLLLKKYSNKKLGLGYLIRLSNAQRIHRFSQLYTIKKEYTIGQINQRFLSDQTFVPNEPTLFRFRYRIGLTSFFNKKKKIYTKLNQESLLKLNFPNTVNFEFRLLPLLGLSIQKNQIMEFGLDYRISFLEKNATSHGQYWLYLGYGIILK